jgi:hypothetical protein
MISNVGYYRIFLIVAMWIISGFVWYVNQIDPNASELYYTNGSIIIIDLALGLEYIITSPGWEKATTGADVFRMTFSETVYRVFLVLCMMKTTGLLYLINRFAKPGTSMDMSVVFYSILVLSVVLAAEFVITSDGWRMIQNYLLGVGHKVSHMFTKTSSTSNATSSTANATSSIRKRPHTRPSSPNYDDRNE